MKKREMVICIVFVVLFAGCSSSPKLFVTKQVSEFRQMPIQIGRNSFYLVKSVNPDDLIGYTLNANISDKVLQGARQELARLKRLPSYGMNYELKDLYYYQPQSIKLIIDGVTYSLDDYGAVKIDTYIVAGQITRLGEDARIAILNCSQLIIETDSSMTDRGAINIDSKGLAAIKKFLK